MYVDYKTIVTKCLKDNIRMHGFKSTLYKVYKWLDVGKQVETYLFVYI